MIDYTKIRLPIKYSETRPFRRKLVREEYVRRQKGKCYYCKAPLSEKPAAKVLAKPLDKSCIPKNFFDYPVHLHHCHITDDTIGAVHAYCNAVLWQYYGE